jgi:hypothetical protein
MAFVLPGLEAMFMAVVNWFAWTEGSSFSNQAEIITA